MFHLILILIITSQVTAKNDSLTSISVTRNEEIFGNVTSHCKIHPCVTKCCLPNEVLNSTRSCVKYSGVLDYSVVKIYNKDLQVTTKKIDVDLQTVKLWELKSKLSLNLARMPKLNRYLTEDGILNVESPNDYKRWHHFNNSEYCMEYQLVKKPNTIATLNLYWWVMFNNEVPKTQDLRITSCAMLVSSFFLALVLVVYAMLPTLRNLPGLVLMAYASSQLGAFLSLGVLQLLKLFRLNTTMVCRVLSPMTYYFFLASFCWMNIMSFDIWWTFRGYAKARAIHRRGERFKFGMYCLYAFGVPLAMTAMLLVFLFTDMSQWPGVITPNIPKKGCFLEGGERFLYMYVPMLIIILSNWTLFLMTAFNVWRLRRGTAVLDANENRAHRTHKQRFGVYLKLSVVMGVSWVLEVISSLKPELQIWIATDLYNLLMGLFVFIIFICKKKIFKMIAKKLNKDPTNQSTGKTSQRSAISSSSSGYEPSHEPAFVSFNPKGPATWSKTTY